VREAPAKELGDQGEQKERKPREKALVPTGTLHPADSVRFAAEAGQLRTRPAKPIRRRS
jgi:hypothetical protein